MPDRLIRFLSLAAMLCAAQTTGWTQSAVPRGQGAAGGVYAAPAAPAAVPAERPALMVDPDRKLAVGDQLSFEILEDHEPAPQPKQVSSEGAVEIFPAGRIKVAGLTPAQAENEIKRRLEADYYYKATVRLSLDKVNDQASMGWVYLSGEVNGVGQQPLYSSRPLTVSNAILNAGGIGKFGDHRKVKVTRQVRGGGTQTFELDVKDIIERGRVEKDMLLQDGDRIFVPKRIFNW